MSEVKWPASASDPPVDISEKPLAVSISVKRLMSAGAITIGKHWPSRPIAMFSRLAMRLEIARITIKTIINRDLLWWELRLSFEETLAYVHLLEGGYIEVTEDLHIKILRDHWDGLHALCVFGPALIRLRNENQTTD